MPGIQLGLAAGQLRQDQLFYQGFQALRLATAREIDHHSIASPAVSILPTRGQGFRGNLGPQSALSGWGFLLLSPVIFAVTLFLGIQSAVRVLIRHDSAQ